MQVSPCHPALRVVLLVDCDHGELPAFGTVDVSEVVLDESVEQRRAPADRGGHDHATNTHNTSGLPPYRKAIRVLREVIQRPEQQDRVNAANDSGQGSGIPENGGHPRGRCRLSHMLGHRFDNLDVVADLRQRAGVGVGRSRYVQQCRGRIGEHSGQDVPRAQEAQPALAGREAGPLAAPLVVLHDLGFSMQSIVYR